MIFNAAEMTFAAFVVCIIITKPSIKSGGLAFMIIIDKTQ